MNDVLLSVLDFLGCILSLFVAGIIGQTLISWRGKFRSQLFMIVVGIILFGLGFLAGALKEFGIPVDLQTFFFLLGIAMLSWGSTQIFTYTYYSSGDTQSPA